MLLKSVFISVFAISVLFPGTVYADLLQTVEAALNYHPSIKAAEAASEIAAQEKRETFSRYFPELSVSASAGRVYGDNATSRGTITTRGSGYSYTADGNITASQLLFDGFETQNRYDASKARVDSAIQNLLDTKENMALQGVGAYIAVLKAQKSLTLLNGYMPQLQGYQKKLKTMVDEGVADLSELSQAQNIQLVLDDIVVGYEGDLEASLAQYIEVTGKAPEGKLKLPVPNLTLIPKTVSEAADMAVASHPSLQALEYDREAALYDSKAAKGLLTPDFTGEFSYYQKDLKEELGGEVVDGKALVRMNWNFSTGGAQLAQIKKAKYQTIEAQANADIQRQSIIRDVKISYSGMRVSAKREELAKDRALTARDILETTKKQFDGGKVKLLQLMQAENSYLNAKLTAENAKLDYLIAQYQILATSGKLISSLYQNEGSMPKG